MQDCINHEERQQKEYYNKAEAAREIGVSYLNFLPCGTEWQSKRSLKDLQGLAPQILQQSRRDAVTKQTGPGGLV